MRSITAAKRQRSKYQISADEANPLLESLRTIPSKKPTAVGWLQAQAGPVERRANENDGEKTKVDERWTPVKTRKIGSNPR